MGQVIKDSAGVDNMSIKEVILSAASACGECFAYYDRKDDEELTMQALEDALSDGVVTPVDIAEAFARGAGMDDCFIRGD